MEVMILIYVPIMRRLEDGEDEQVCGAVPEARA
jgi:hypothetical protein